MKQAIIQFKNQIIDQCEEQLKQFLNKSDKPFELIFTETDLTVMIDEKKEKNQTLENIRMIAGNVARTLRKSKIEQADINYDSLINAYDSLNNNQVLAAFVEGWELGLYEYDKYKSKKIEIKTNLNVKANEDVSSIINESKQRAKAVAF